VYFALFARTSQLSRNKQPIVRLQCLQSPLTSPFASLPVAIDYRGLYLLLWAPPSKLLNMAIYLGFCPLTILSDVTSAVTCVYLWLDIRHEPLAIFSSSTRPQVFHTCLTYHYSYIVSSSSEMSCTIALFFPISPASPNGFSVFAQSLCETHATYEDLRYVLHPQVPSKKHSASTPIPSTFTLFTPSRSPRDAHTTYHDFGKIIRPSNGQTSTKKYQYDLVEGSTQCPLVSVHHFKIGVDFICRQTSL
jgi:hypothetical protein